jgi:peptidoglycan-N-acetylglucosamine deacetylase
MLIYAVQSGERGTIFVNRMINKGAEAVKAIKIILIALAVLVLFPAIKAEAARNNVGPGAYAQDTQVAAGSGTYVRNSLADAGPGVEQPQTTNIDPSKPMVALTFDDGPSAVNTPRVLAALEAVGGHATFFVIGANVSKNASLLQRMVADGDEIGNHTWNHNYLHKATSEEIVTYINQTADAVQAACGVRPVAVRPPGGGINQTAQDTLAALGSPAILWDIDTRDWEHRDTAKTVSAVLDHVSDGDIVLMHDIHEPTVAAAELIIPELVSRGYQLVTVTELASMRGGYVPGQKYYSFKNH